MPKVCLAVTANHDKVDRDFMMHLVTLMRPANTIVSLRGAHIKAASLNEHVTEAANNDCSHIFFMDVDMNFPPWTLARLMSHKLPIVTGLYHLKGTPFAPIMGWTNPEGVAVNGNGHPWKDDYCPLPSNQLVDIDWCGIGCLLVDMDVFNKIYFPPFKDTWDDEAGRRQKGHDIIFCEEARKAGYKIFADTSVDVTHIGRSFVNKAYVETYHRLNMDHELLDTIHGYTTTPTYWDETWMPHAARGSEWPRPNTMDVITPNIPDGVAVVDLGCGVGSMLKALKNDKQCDVYGVDFSETSLRILAKKGIPGEVADLRSYKPGSRTAHTVIASHVLEHMPNMDIAGELVRTAASMATEQVFICVPVDYVQWIEHSLVFTRDNLQALLDKYFKNVVITEIAKDNLGNTTSDLDLVAWCREPIKSAQSDEVQAAATG